MRSHPRSQHSVGQRLETALRGVEARQPAGDLAPGPETGATGPGAGECLDLVPTGPGLVIGHTDNRELAVPSLVPWSLVQVSAAEGPEGDPEGPVLCLEVADAEWLGGGDAWNLKVREAEAVPFLDEVAARKAVARRDEYRFLGIAVGAGIGRLAVLPASASRWVRSLRPAGGDPRHGLGRGRIAPVMVGLMALVLLAGSTSVPFGSSVSGATGHPHAAADAGNRNEASSVHTTPSLAAATSAPAPAPPSLAGSAPLAPHEVFGYAPYWTLPQSSGFDVQDLTTLAYFSVDANADGTLDESGPGWNGYESQDLVNLVDRSHAAGARVVLTVTCFDQSTLDAITSDPNAPARLASALIAAVSAKNLDGVNFDFEGEGSADRAGLTHLITQVSNALHAANPHWQVTMATYASAAGDSGGFYDIAGLAPALDGFFVMAYDMNDQSTPSATAPLIGGGFNDTEALQQFTAVVPASKIILGVPYYGYDWPTTNGTYGAQAMGPEAPLSDGVIEASGEPTYWDPSTDTAWTSYQVGSQWHETYFDDPTSLAMKAQLANSFHIAGLGIWALGMDGNNPAMLAALLGNAPATKDLSSGPTATSSSPSPTTTATGPAGSGFATSGVWKGANDPLNPITPPATDGNAVYQGTLSSFTTNDPALACLESGPPLKVWTFSTLPGVDVALATQPEDCATAMWTFVPPSATGDPGGGAPTAAPPTPTSTSTSTSTTSTSTTTTSTTSTTSTTGP